jgi:HAD superfamily hydrolase (TIGR01549 family)
MTATPPVVYGKIDVGAVKGLLFDVDGTLSDTDDHMVEKFIRLMRPIAWVFQHKNTRPFARWLVMAVETPANFIYGIPDKFGFDEPLAKFYNRLAQKHRAGKSPQDRFWIIDGVKDMLSRLSAHYPMAVVSARDAETTHYFLEHFGLLPFFEVVVTAHTCEHTKPYPDPLLFAAERLSVPIEHCLMIGDTIVDIHAGKRAGAQTTGVLCGFGRQKELIRAGADQILTTTADLTDQLLVTD